MSNEYQKVMEKLVAEYPQLVRAAKSDKELKILASFYNIGSNYPKLNDKILKLAFDTSKEFEPKNLNDFYSILIASIQNINGFKKNAYPQFPLAASDNIGHEFDLAKWSKLVYKIYDAVLANDMTLDTAIDYYSGTLNKKAEEDFKFKQWIKYYLDGENKRYAKKKSLIKSSSFESGLGPSNFYHMDTKPMSEHNDIPAKRLLENNIEEINNKQRVKEWREKLDSAIRRLDKLIRQSPGLIGTDTSVELAQSLHEFDMSVRQIQLQTTAVDLTYGAANKFKKVGFSAGYDLLQKTAQELEGLEEESAPPEAAPEVRPPEPQQRAPLSSQDPVSRIYENNSGAKEGEYEKLDSNINLTDAISKLEEIAARLSDRRVIRLLAEFDIMLDKIGIAAMFPELSESQSKLIDGYSYALVRVTKMLGMLSSGKNLGEISEAKKQEMTSNIRKDVNKTFNREEDEGIEGADVAGQTPAKGQEAIQEEFQEAPPTPPKKPSGTLPGVSEV